MGRFNLVTYQSHETPLVWPHVEPLIKRAIDRGSNYTLEEIQAGLTEQKFQLWACQSDKFDAALITTLQDGNCLLLAAGGEYMKVWVQWLPLVEEWARSKGCGELVIYGRKGWAKAAGFEVAYTKLVKKL